MRRRAGRDEILTGIGHSRMAAWDGVSIRGCRAWHRARPDPHEPSVHREALQVGIARAEPAIAGCLRDERQGTFGVPLVE